MKYYVIPYYNQIMMKASDLFLRCLESEGVEYIFGLPGEENIDLMFSLLNSNIKFILARHEQGAAFMADIKPITKPHRTLKSRPHKGLIKKAVKIISSAKIPIILVGNGCIRGCGSSNIRKFVEKTGIFSMNTFMAKGV